MPPKKKEETEEYNPATDEEVAELIKSATAAVAKKINYNTEKNLWRISHLKMII